MATKNMVANLPKILPLNDFCEECVNHHHAPFESGESWHARKPLEIIHFDLCCINKLLLGDLKYILTFINDFLIFT